MRILRLFAILDELRLRRHPVSAEFLADTLDVSIRTIYRDMTVLQALGAPIRGEGGVGYQMEKGYFLPPLHFDPDEIDAIVLGMQLVAARGDEPLANAALRASAKIRAVLSDDRKETYSNSPLLAYSAPPEEHGRSIEFLSPLRIALRERERLRISYCDLKEQQSTRRIRPLGLTAFDNVWLLTAWCEAKSGFRNFRVDRLKSVERTGETFRHELGKEFTDYLQTL